MLDWKKAIEEEWARRAVETTAESPMFPLVRQSFDAREIIAAVDVLLSGRLTMARCVEDFEAQFAHFLGVPHAVMVNSGSSANLLAMAVASNPARANHLRPGDGVLIPAVCWPTSLWPIVQCQLEPIFVDVDPKTLNVDLADVRRKITPRTRAMMGVHVLGNSAPMTDLLDILNYHNVMLLEDTCESLGSRAGGKYLGTLGQFGMFSFYYSHHITTGEGGMVVCKNDEDNDLLRCMRSHGWSRSISNRAKIEQQHPTIDPRFLFINAGFNLRSTEVQGAFGIDQLKRLPEMNRIRNINKARLTSALTTHPKWREQMSFPIAPDGTEPAWFGFPCLLGDELASKRGAYLDYLSAHGIENRPLISGNFMRQPALRLFKLQKDPKTFPGAEIVHERGCFLGVHTELVSDQLIAKLVDILLGF